MSCFFSATYSKPQPMEIVCLTTRWLKKTRQLIQNWPYIDIRCYQAAKMVIFYKSSYLYIFINRACVSMYVVVFILELHSSCKRCRRLHSPHWTTNHRWNIADWKLFHLDKGRCSLSKVVLNYLHPHKYGTSGSQPKNLVRYQP